MTRRAAFVACIIFPIGSPAKGACSVAPVPAKAAMVAMGLLDDDTLRAPLLPLADAPRERLTTLLRTLGLVEGGGRQELVADVVAA